MADALSRSASNEESENSNSPPKKRSGSSIDESTITEDLLNDEEITAKDIERYECIICCNWLDEPMLTSCGHRFCRKCLQGWLKKENRCPIDQKILSIIDIFPDNFTRREIQSLRKSCRFRIFGCNVKCSPLELEKHMQECRYSDEEPQLPCHFKNMGCTFVTKDKSQLEDHLAKSYGEHLDFLLKAFTKNQFESWDPEKHNGTQPSDTNELLRAMYERIVVLEQTNREQTIKIERLEALNAKRNFSNGTLIWRLEDFRNKIEAMRSNPNLMYYSCEAYTSPQGYRFCGRLNLSSKVRDALSLHVHLMKSENDYHLEWPFVGRLKISMIHPLKFEESQVDVMMSKPEVLAFHRPHQEISARGFGFQEYAFINEMLKKGFVSDDNVLTIKIQMNIV